MCGSYITIFIYSNSIYNPRLVQASLRNLKCFQIKQRQIISENERQLY